MIRRVAGIAFVVTGLGFAVTACAPETSVEESEEAESDQDEIRGGKKCGSPTRTYVSRDPEQCMAVRFFCEEGVAFFDNCGCGCDTAQTQCGPNVCGAGQVCCNASCGICTQPDMVCTQQACDGGEPI